MKWIKKFESLSSQKWRPMTDKDLERMYKLSFQPLSDEAINDIQILEQNKKIADTTYYHFDGTNWKKLNSWLREVGPELVMSISFFLITGEYKLSVDIERKDDDWYKILTVDKNGIREWFVADEWEGVIQFLQMQIDKP